jgi:hypothetical protein
LLQIRSESRLECFAKASRPRRKALLKALPEKGLAAAFGRGQRSANDFGSWRPFHSLDVARAQRLCIRVGKRSLFDRLRRHPAKPLVRFLRVRFLPHILSLPVAPHPGSAAFERIAITRFHRGGNALAHGHGIGRIALQEPAEDGQLCLQHVSLE